MNYICTLGFLFIFGVLSLSCDTDDLDKMDDQPTEMVNMADTSSNTDTTNNTDTTSVDPDTTTHAAEMQYSYLALGDSYTVGESVAYAQTFPARLMEKFPDSAYALTKFDIVAQTGWRTDNLLSAIESNELDAEYTFVTLLIGVNDEFQGYDTEWYKPKFIECLQTALSFAGNDVNRVLVVSIPDYDYTPYGQNSSRQNTSERIDWYNEVNKAVSDSLGVSYVNITPISRNGLDDPALVASDNLHPSGKQYGLWAEEIFPLAKAIVDQYGEK